MRITGGEWRSRVLQVPPDQNITRPTMDQTRQAIFNILNAAAWALQPNGQSLLLNGTMLDGFAGSGAMGFEALSRGAQHVTFVDQDVQAVQAIERNIAQFKCKPQTALFRADMLKIPARSEAPVTLCFLDPPYQDHSYPAVLHELQQRGWIDANTLIVLETNSKQTRETNAALDGIANLHDQRRYGHALVSFFRLS